MIDQDLISTPAVNSDPLPTAEDIDKLEEIVKLVHFINDHIAQAQTAVSTVALAGGIHSPVFQKVYSQLVTCWLDIYDNEYHPRVDLLSDMKKALKEARND
jgi:hypothetical protein